MAKPYFIAVEGIEGVGKSTLIQEIADYFKARDLPFNLTREPGGTPFAEKLRTSVLKDKSEPIEPITELLLMFASRSQHVHQHIKPLLAQGTSVISDRFVAASYAYQGGGRGLNETYLKQLDQMVCGDLHPDYTILITAPVEVALSRIQSRSEGTDRIEEEAHTFFEKVQNKYLELAKNDPSYIVIDSNRDLDLVKQDLHKALDKIVC